VIVSHVAITTVDGYLTRPEPERQAGIQHLMGLRAHGAVVAAGLAPDGRTADLVCRVEQPDHVAKLVETSPLFRNGLWTAYASRSFAQFLEPWDAPPPRRGEMREATIVEGAAPDAEMASFALIEARGAGHALLAGFFEDNRMLALMTIADPTEAAAHLDATGLFTAGTLRGRRLLLEVW